MDISRRIREVREDLGMPAAELARRVGVAPNTVWRYESGEREPSMAMLEKIARELRTEPAELLREPVAAGKADASPSAEQPPLKGGQEERRAEGVPGWVTEWLRPDFQRAGEALDEICRKWAERQQRGELDHDAIEQFFEDAEHWSFVVDTVLSVEALQLIQTGQVRVDPNIDPNDLGTEFFDMLDRLFSSTGKLGSAWSRWMDLQNEFLAQAEDLKIDPKKLERIRKAHRASGRCPTWRTRPRAARLVAGS